MPHRLPEQFVHTFVRQYKSSVGAVVSLEGIWRGKQTAAHHGTYVFDKQFLWRVHYLTNLLEGFGYLALVNLRRPGERFDHLEMGIVQNSLEQAEYGVAVEKAKSTVQILWATHGNQYV